MVKTLDAVPCCSLTPCTIEICAGCGRYRYSKTRFDIVRVENTRGVEAYPPVTTEVWSLLEQYDCTGEDPSCMASLDVTSTLRYVLKITGDDFAIEAPTSMYVEGPKN